MSTTSSQQEIRKVLRNPTYHISSGGSSDSSPIRRTQGKEDEASDRDGVHPVPRHLPQSARGDLAIIRLGLIEEPIGEVAETHDQQMLPGNHDLTFIYHDSLCTASLLRIG